MERFRPGKDRAKEEHIDSADYRPLKGDEEVLSHLHGAVSRHRSQEPHRLPNDEYELLHDDIRHCESFLLFSKYVSGEVPTMYRMFDALQGELQRASEQLAHERTFFSDVEYAEQKKILTLLSGRKEQVHGAIQRYVRSVIRFQQLAKLSAGGVRDISKQFEEADHSRRRAHNALIESLNVYMQAVRQAISEGLLEKEVFGEWSIGEDARAIPHNKVVVFSEEILSRNRDFIRDWAIAADFYEQLEALEDQEWMDTIKEKDRSR